MPLTLEKQGYRPMPAEALQSLMSRVSWWRCCLLVGLKFRTVENGHGVHITALNETYSARLGVRRTEEAMVMPQNAPLRVA
jgi:hypothetical protein